MYTNKRISRDKGIIILSIISVIALSALIAGMMMNKEDKPGISQIVQLDETTASSVSDETTVKTEEKVAANVEKETTEVSTETPTETYEIPESSTQEPASVNAAPTSPSFTTNSVLLWPVETNDVIIDFSMDATTYFATLDMYKTSDAVCVRSEIGSPVYAAADGIITANSYNEEIGRFISMDLGDQYELTYGQLKDIQVDEGTTVSAGDLIGYISEPTKYYSVEGANLYLKMSCNGTPTDPLDYLNYGE